MWQHVAGLYMIALPNRKLLFFADATVNIDPDEETLAEIAVLSAGFVRELEASSPGWPSSPSPTSARRPTPSPRRCPRRSRRIRESGSRPGGGWGDAGGFCVEP